MVPDSELLMPEYCAFADVQKRLTEAGVHYISDRDLDERLSAAEKDDYIIESIEWSGQQIDAALRSAKLDYASIRSQNSTYLKFLCVDLSCERACGIGGGGVPESLATSAERAWESLRMIRRGEAIPDVIPSPSQPSGTPKYDVTSGQPIVVNFR